MYITLNTKVEGKNIKKLKEEVSLLMGTKLS
jgi:hypothetical protein